jgi:Glycosyl hydrolase family 12
MRFSSLVRPSFVLSLLFSGLTLTACMTSGSGGATGGTGGTTTGGTGGTGSGGTGSGGSGSGGAGSGTGGSGSGGSVASGGNSGSGGDKATGGSTGGAATGGSTGSGGAASTGGSTGTGGSATGGAGGGSQPGGGCTPAALTMTGALNGRYGSMLFDNNSYFMQVNEWNSSGSQVMSYGGDYLFKMTTQMGSTATNGGPTGFPSVFIGANSKHTTSNSNLPKAVSALTTVPTSWTWNDNGTLADDTTNSYNATYDVWFSTIPAGEPMASGPSGGYLMVWYHKPADAQPIGGSPMKKAITIAGVPGTWDVWIGPNGTRPCISYVATQTTLSMSYDLNLFIQDAVKNQPNTIQSSWYLTNIFTGFEIWRGAVNVESTSFCALVN